MGEWNSSAAILGSLSYLEGFLILLVAALLFMIWKLTHHQECNFAGSIESSIDDSLHALSGATHGRLIGGNSVKLIQNEDYFGELTKAIDSARITAHLETFLWTDGEASTLVVEALVEAARRGVTVRILADASGSNGLSKKSVATLREGGCIFHWYHKVRLSNLGRINIRDHRKLLVVDGKSAIVGGHCITDQWLKDGEKLPRHRDISVIVEGPVVSSVQSCFFENWTETTKELFTDSDTFPAIPEAGEVRAHVAYVKADRCPSAVQVLHHLSIGYAKKSIRIQNPYFLPDPCGTRALARAASRGVDVRIMIPGLNATDSPKITRAGRFQFQRLLEGGVRIFEYRKTLLHQKVMTIDGSWCSVGSSNFDDRSFEINDEITLGIADHTLCGDLDAIFDDDLRECQEITLEAWRRRPLWERCIDGALYLFNEQF